MKPIKIMLPLAIFSLLTAVLFQNCSDGFESSASGATNNGPNGIINPNGPAGPLASRQIPLDNPNIIGATRWFANGGTDRFYFETTYGASSQSTLISMRVQEPDVFLQVDSDLCDGEKIMTSQEQSRLSLFLENYIPPTLQKIADPAQPTTAGCAFPRLVLDSSFVYQDGTEAIDYSIYFSGPECTPDGNLYVAELDGVDPAAARDEVETFFKEQIDQVCGL